MRVLTAALIGLIFLSMPGGQLAALETGSATNLPLPRYVSLKASEGNVRRGPSLTHRIDWVFKRRDMPLQITAEHGHWRRVQDRDGQAALDWGIYGAPETFVIDAQGIVRYKHIGPLTDEIIAAEILPALKGAE